VSASRIRVARGVLAEGDGDGAQLLAGRSILVHVSSRKHCDLIDRPHQAERDVELRVAADLGTGPCPGPPTGAAVACAPANDGARPAGFDRHGGVAHRRATSSAAVANLAEEAQVRNAEVARNLDLRSRLHVEAHEPVHVRRHEAGIIERQPDCFERDLALAAADTLGELRLADPGDGDPRHG